MKQIEKEEYQKERYERVMRERAEEERIRERDKKLKQEAREREARKEAKMREKARIQYLIEQSDIKRKAAYVAEMKERTRLAKPAWKPKTRELIGKEAGQIALQRQRETEILNERLSREENERTELWRQSERERMAGLPEKRRLEKLATEEAIRLKDIEEENKKRQREIEIENIRLRKIEEENRKRQKKEAKRKKLEEDYGFLMHGTYNG